MYCTQAAVSGLGSGSPSIKLSNSADTIGSPQFQVLLVKLRQGPLTEADLPANVAVSTISASPLSSLYHNLKDVYSPLLGYGDGVNNGKTGAVPARLQELLQQVRPPSTTTPLADR